MKCGIHTRFQVYSTETCQTIAKPDNHARNPGKHRTITCNRYCKQSNPHRNPSPRIFNRPTTIASMQLFTRASSHVGIPVNNRKSQAFASMTSITCHQWQHENQRPPDDIRQKLNGHVQHHHRYVATNTLVPGQSQISDKRLIPGFPTLTYAIMTEPLALKIPSSSHHEKHSVSQTRFTSIPHECQHCEHQKHRSKPMKQAQTI